MKIVVFSCANTGNFGDDIILEGIKIKLSKEYPGVKGNIHQVLRINKETIEFINTCDFLIVGGGEILSHSDVLEQLTAHDVKIPYMFLSVGVGGKEDILPYLDKLNPTAWYARTKSDLEILKDCGIENAMMHLDPIFMCPVERNSNGRIGLNLKPLHKDQVFIYNMATILDALIENGIKVDFLSLNSIPRHEVLYCGENILISDCDGIALINEIKKQMNHQIDVVSYKGKDPLEFLNIIASYKAIVGERLHSVMAAYHAGIDFRVIPYHLKIDKFLDTFGLLDKIIEHDPMIIGKAIEGFWNA